MLAAHTPELLAKLTTLLNAGTGKITPPTTGHEAAVATVDLMRRTFKNIKPMDIVDAYADGEDLWQRFGQKTVGVIHDGVKTLQAIWIGAWKAGNGDKILPSKLVAADTDELIKLYRRSTWMPSKVLKTIKPILK